MSYLDVTLRSYIEHAGAAQPTPGGGSVCALVGALGVSMGQMAANFTVGREKFKAVENRVRADLGQLDEGLRVLLAAVDRDSESYCAVSKAYAMVASTAEDKKARTEAIQDALRAAMKPPLEVCRRCYELLKVVQDLREVANPNLLSDVAVCAVMLQAALEGAKINVMVNLAPLKDQETVDQIKEEIDEMESLAGMLTRQIVEGIERDISGG